VVDEPVHTGSRIVMFAQ